MAGPWSRTVSVPCPYEDDETGDACGADIDVLVEFDPPMREGGYVVAPGGMSTDFDTCPHGHALNAYENDRVHKRACEKAEVE